jgi:uncharacterized protein YndB with AHSA1/START domain
MKILKGILLILTLIFTLIFIGSLFLPSKYHVERSIVINAPADSIFQYANNLQNMNKWLPFKADYDTTFLITYSSQVEGVGASQKWDGKKLGSGSMKIIKSEPNKLVETEVTLGEGKVKSNGTFLLNETGGGVKITWQDEGSLGFNPVARIFGLFYDKLLGPDYETGLQNLKKICEKK